MYSVENLFQRHSDPILMRNALAFNQSIAFVKSAFKRLVIFHPQGVDAFRDFWGSKTKLVLLHTPRSLFWKHVYDTL
jgi:hypothetical protein